MIYKSFCCRRVRILLYSKTLYLHIIVYILGFISFWSHAFEPHFVTPFFVIRNSRLYLSTVYDFYRTY